MGRCNQLQDLPEAVASPYCPPCHFERLPAPGAHFPHFSAGSTDSDGVMMFISKTATTRAKAAQDFHEAFSVRNHRTPPTYRCVIR